MTKKAQKIVFAAAVLFSGTLIVPGLVSAKKTKKPTGNITGSVIQLTQQISYPALTTPAGATNLSAVTVKKKKPLTLTAGTYVCSSMDIKANGVLTINAAAGPVKLYCTGAFTCNGEINVTSNIPKNFQLYVVGAGAVKLTGVNFYGVIDAPQSAVTLSSSTQLYGSCIGNTMTVDKDCNVHYDEALGNNGVSPPGVSQVN